MQQYRESEITIYIFILKKQRKGNCCNQIKKLGNKNESSGIFYFFISDNYRRDAFSNEKLFQ